MTSQAEPLRVALNKLPRVRLTGEQLDGLDPDPEKHVWVDWDEYEDFVSLADVRAAIEAQAPQPVAGLDAARLCGAVMATCRNEQGHPGDHWHPGFRGGEVPAVPRRLPGGSLPRVRASERKPGDDLHETHVCRDCGAAITLPYASLEAEAPQPVAGLPDDIALAIDALREVALFIRGGGGFDTTLDFIDGMIVRLAKSDGSKP